MDNIHVDKLGKASFYSARILAWHTLGVVTKDAVTSEEAIKLAGLDFRVGKRQLWYDGGESGWGNNLIGLDKMATYRKDTGAFLGGIVSDNYQIIQNLEAFNFMDSLIQDGKMVYETAGALGSGETIFVTCKLPGEIIVGKDNIDKYLLLTMSHDGKSSIQVLFTPVRVVCYNTLSQALGSAKNKVNIRHSSNYKDKLEEAKKVLVKSQEAFAGYQEKFDNLLNLKVSKAEVIDVIKTLYLTSEEKKDLQNGKKYDEAVSTRKRNVMNDVWRSYTEGVGQENIQGTAWGVVNGVTNYYQNVKTYNSAESQFDKVFGNNPYIANAFAYFDNKVLS